MWEIHNLYESGNSVFSDQDILGIFVSNHDNPRWLHMYGDWTTFKSVITFLFFSRGIPIFYYGDEQGFAGGADPGCRETLWNVMNTDSELFKYVKQLNEIRAEYKSYNFDFQEYWVEDNLYVMRRGDLLIAVTTAQQGSNVNYDITNHPYKPGDKVCDLLNDQQCFTVSNDNTFPIQLKDGQARIYVLQSSSQ